MQPLPQEEVFPGLDMQTQEGSLDIPEPESSFGTFGGLILAMALGLYSWAAILLLLRWIF